jgi:Ca2+-binding RTX toxin-like protein
MSNGIIVSGPGRTVIGDNGSDRVFENGDTYWDRQKSKWVSIAAHDYVDGGAGDDFIWGNYGNDTLIGGAGDDYLDGGAGINVVRGGAGNDRLLSGGPYATLEGGSGNDHYEYLNSGEVIVRDTSGKDTITLGDLHHLSGVYRAAGSNDLTIKMESGLFLTIEAYFSESSHIETLNFDGVKWRLKDVLEALERPQNPIKNDVLYGSGGDDVIDGGKGDDILYGLRGHDVLMGGDGKDTLSGWQGNDTLIGGAGDDSYRVNWGTDGEGNDTIIDTGGANDVLRLDTDHKPDQLGLWRSGKDLILIGDRAVTIENYFDESGHIETIKLGHKSEWHLSDVLARLSDGPVPDLPPSDADPDSQPGHSIVAGTEKEIFEATAGQDTFVFASASRAGRGKTSDKIVGFQHGDTVDLSAIDANTATRGDDVFKTLLVGKKAFTKAGQLRYDSKTGLLSGNTDKDAAAEFQIYLKNNKFKALHIGDFDL